MPSIVLDAGDVHYEVIGSGPPVILIHGWTQAWNTWRTTLESFEGQYRMYAPDLWGFGESEKLIRESFEVEDFIDLIPEFMDKLGIGKVPHNGALDGRHDCSRRCPEVSRPRAESWCRWLSD